LSRLLASMILFECDLPLQAFIHTSALRVLIRLIGLRSDTATKTVDNLISYLTQKFRSSTSENYNSPTTTTITTTTTTSNNDNFLRKLLFMFLIIARHPMKEAVPLLSCCGLSAIVVDQLQTCVDTRIRSLLMGLAFALVGGRGEEERERSDEVGSEGDDGIADEGPLRTTSTTKADQTQRLVRVMLRMLTDEEDREKFEDTALNILLAIARTDSGAQQILSVVRVDADGESDVVGEGDEGGQGCAAFTNYLLTRAITAQQQSGGDGLHAIALLLLALSAEEKRDSERRAERVAALRRWLGWTKETAEVHPLQAVIFLFRLKAHRDGNQGVSAILLQRLQQLVASMEEESQEQEREKEAEEEQEREKEKEKENGMEDAGEEEEEHVWEIYSVLRIELPYSGHAGGEEEDGDFSDSSERMPFNQTSSS